MGQAADPFLLLVLLGSDSWVGGTLRQEGNDTDDCDFSGCVSCAGDGQGKTSTKITGIELRNDYFEVQGEDFNCGGVAIRLTLTKDEDGSVTFHEPPGNRFTILPIGMA